MPQKLGRMKFNRYEKYEKNMQITETMFEFP